VPHRIEVFSGNCPLCERVVAEIEAGKCARCQLVVHRVSDDSELARNYGVKVVPTIFIDGEVRIEGHPDIPFVCSDETYAYFRERYPLVIQATPYDDSQ
jgi:protein-disulfide isomerase